MSTRFLVLLALLLLGSQEILAQDPVNDFIVESDALAQSGDEAALAKYVADHGVLLGAVIGQLVDVALQIRADNPSAAEENVAFAERLASLSDDSAASSAIDDYRSWDARDLDRRDAAKQLEAEAQEARDAGELDLAVETLERARAELETLRDRRSVAVIWGSLGVVHWYRGDWDSVRASYERALEERRSIGDAILEGRTLNGLGSVNFNTGALAEAVVWYERAIARRRETGDLVGLGTSLGYAANCRLQLGETAAARALFEESVPVLEATGNAAKLIEVLNGVGNLQHQTGDYGEAEASYRRGLRLIAENAATDFAALLHVNLANTLRFSGRTREALQELSAGQSVLEIAPDLALRARLEHERAALSMLLGEQDAAREALIEATRSAAEVGDPGLQADIALTTAILYRQLDALTRSLDMAEGARELAEEMGDLGRLRDAYTGLALTHELLGDYDQALTRLEQALQLDTDGERDGLIAQDEIRIANIRSTQGRVLDARAGYRRASKILRRTGRSDALWTPALGLADSFEQSDPDSAYYWYDKSLSLLEEDRRRWGGAAERSGFLLDARGRAYEEITRYYAQQHEAGSRGDWRLRALLVGDRAKARGLSEQLDESNGLPSLDKEALERLQRSLPRDRAVLSYAVGDSSSFLWVLRRNSVKQHRLPSRSELRARVQQLRDAVARPGAGDSALRESAHKLYAQWLSPAEKDLRGVRHLSVIPDDALFELPFAMLLREAAPAEQAWSECDWLGRKWSTSYYPSLSLLAWAGENQLSKTGFESELLALGGAIFSEAAAPGSTRPLQSLPHTLDEIDSISTAVGKGRATLLLGEKATEEGLTGALRASMPRVLHLATHGIVDPYEPARSSIALSAGTEEGADGYWHAFEVQEEALVCELVVLSACETGRGRLERGEGVLGLTRAFLASGVEGVVASLWSVADASTAQLMSSFYRSMYESGESVAESMQSARAELLQEPLTSHPFHWAAFVVTTPR